MALWLVRAGRHGEHESHFFAENKLFVTWGGLNHDLSKLQSRDDLQAVLTQIYPNAPKGKIRNNSGQLWPFAHVMNSGDWVIVPYKGKPAVNIGEIAGPYVFDADANDPYFHSRAVKWIAQDIPRSNFDQDILYSIGAFMTICRIERNNAEQRVRAMQKNGWKAAGHLASIAIASDSSEPPDVFHDLEQVGRDAICKLIIARFKGHGMARLVEAILKVKGYTTYLSPEGPDKGVDILASPDSLGFGSPRICVQVKSGDSPVDLPTLNQLIGTMQNVHADKGLFVSWGGFKSSIDREEATQFFRVRLWDQRDLVDQILQHYDQLDDEIRSELPLKRIWTVAEPNADDE